MPSKKEENRNFYLNKYERLKLVFARVNEYMTKILLDDRNETEITREIYENDGRVDKETVLILIFLNFLDTIKFDLVNQGYTETDPDFQQFCEDFARVIVKSREDGEFLTSILSQISKLYEPKKRTHNRGTRRLRRFYK